MGCFSIARCSAGGFLFSMQKSEDFLPNRMPHLASSANGSYAGIGGSSANCGGGIS